jgi:hypothetical protein
MWRRPPFPPDGLSRGMAVAADGSGNAAFQRIKFLLPALFLNRRQPSADAPHGGAQLDTFVFGVSTYAGPDSTVAALPNMARTDMPQERYPVSEMCPICGGAEHRKVQAKGWVAFTDDRVCLSCQTRYTPPTPAWAGIVFLGIGGALFLAGLTGLILTSVALLGRGHTDPIGMALGGGLAVLGLLVVRHGFRSLLKPGKVQGGATTSAAYRHATQA